LGLCSQIELDENVAKAAVREERRLKRAAREAAKNGETLKDATETTALQNEPAPEFVSSAPGKRIDDSNVFSDIPTTSESGDETEEAPRAEDVFKD
jgi:hypothetical protein